MADPSACRDWYFRPARNDFNFGNKRKSHGQGQGFTGGGGGGGGGEGGKTVTFSFSKRRNCCGCMGVGIVMKKTDMLKTSNRTSFLIFSVSSV